MVPSPRPATSLTVSIDPLENVDDLREDWWLEVLIKKYRSEYLTPAENGRVEEEEKSQSQPQRNGNVDAVESKGRPYLPPIAHFSVFLSCCLLEDIDCSPTEQKALYKVPLHFILQPTHSPHPPLPPPLSASSCMSLKISALRMI
jgi:hypothetical protein